MDNFSKLLKMELGQQIPVKSMHKMRRDVVKRVRQFNPTDPFPYGCHMEQHKFWCDEESNTVSLKCVGPLEYSLPNSRWGFFDECVTQKFYDRDLSESTLIVDRDENDDIMFDIYQDVDSYLSRCMDRSNELMTFSVGGPRFFENNVLLKNSPLWPGRNQARYAYKRDVFRDCRYVHGSPLFRHHYEFPTNPSLKGVVVDNPPNWHDIENRDEDIFEDPNEFGYVATQLTHLPKMLGYDIGNILTYSPLYDARPNKNLNYFRKRERLTLLTVVSSFLEQSQALPFKYRTDEIVYAQRDVLHHPSMYVVNRKSLIVNKPHVFYNDDSHEVHCLPLPLARNALKWSEGFLGDCMTYALQCRYEEPMRKIALNMDSAKVGLFERDGSYCTTTPTPGNLPSIRSKDQQT